MARLKSSVMVLLPAAAAVCAPRVQSAADVRIRGELTAVRVDTASDGRSEGVLTVGGRIVVVPAQTRVELPGDTATLNELFARAPARCIALNESGLVRSDSCLQPERQRGEQRPRWSSDDDRTPRTTLDPVPTEEPPPTIVTLDAEPADGGRLVAHRVTLSNGGEIVRGAVTYISAAEGYLRVGGAFGADEGGAIVRLNDPEARQSVQTGRGCGAEGNCSPDARWRANPTRFTVSFELGYPACVPGGLGPACAESSRPVRSLLDGNVMVPIARGDHITARGAFRVVEGLRIFWAHTLIVHTSPLGGGSGQPDFLTQPS